MFELPSEPDPYPIIERLLLEPEHAHLSPGRGGPTMRVLLRIEPKIKAGRMELGSVHLPSVQGALKDVFVWMLDREFGSVPNFLIVLDRDYWQGASDREREILIYHELCHCKQAVDKNGEERFDLEGNPVWALRGHDVEEFTAVVGKYGAHNEDLKAFFGAVGI